MPCGQDWFELNTFWGGEGGGSFFDCNTKTGDSMIWKGILKTRDIIQKGSCFKVGDGWTTNPWIDSWIPRLERKIPKVKDGVSTEGCDRVAQFIDHPDQC